VLSQITGTVVIETSKTYPDVAPHVIASGFAIVSGAVVLGLGLFRCGWIIDIIPLVSLSAFVTGSAITIGMTQFPPILGITNVSTRNSPYLTFINTLQNLPSVHGPDAAVGLTALFLLYAMRSACNALANRYVRKKKLIFFCSTLRTVFAILLYTMISWLVNMNHPQDPIFNILKTVPRGM
jgi:solute carrier family 26 (sodium-independent sulfate anion transporter), member 11